MLYVETRPRFLYEIQALEKIAFLLDHHKLPIVSAGTAMPAGDIDWVAVDREASFERLMQYAFEQGVTRLGFLDTDISKTYSVMKQRVFERLLRTCQLDATAVQIVKKFGTRSVAKTVQEMMARFPDLEGIVMTDNVLAPFVQLVIAGRPIQLFGFGDDIFISLCDPPITYMRLPMRQLAQVAVEHLIRRIEHAENTVALKTLIPCDLVATNQLSAGPLSPERNPPRPTASPPMEGNLRI